MAQTKRTYKRASKGATTSRKTFAKDSSCSKKLRNEKLFLYGWNSKHKMSFTANEVGEIDTAAGKRIKMVVEIQQALMKTTYSGFWNVEKQTLSVPIQKGTTLIASPEGNRGKTKTGRSASGYAFVSYEK